MRLESPLARLFSVAFLLLTASGAGAKGPEAFPNGLILQGPYLFCGDQEAMFHILYEDKALIHGIGLFSGINGYTKPDGMRNLEYRRGTGEVIYRGEIPGSGVEIEQEAVIEGNRIRVRIKRKGEWPAGAWGSIQIALPVREYGGAEYMADGKKYTFPAEYAPGNEYPQGARRLECHLGDPKLNVVFECAAGFSFDDHRRFDAPNYIVGVSLPKEGEDTAEFYVTLPEIAEYRPRASLRYSRIGYPLAGEKYAMLEWPRNAPRPGDEVRIENRRGRARWRGHFGPTQTVDDFQNNYAEFDFSGLNRPGEYRIVWSEGKSEWFQVKESVFDESLWEKTMDYFIPFEMCHAEVDLGEAAPGHGACHKDDAARAPANFTGPDGFHSYEALGTPYAPGQHVSLPLGGWHDAGDFDLNVPAQSFVVWTLALAWEEFGLIRDAGTLDVTDRTWRAGVPDGVPDILQQIEWGARWLLSVQQKDGRVYNGVCAKREQRSGRPLETITDGSPGNEDDRLLYVDYHGDQQLNFIIATAAAGRALKESNPALAKKCLKAARKAFRYFERNDEVYRAGSYTDPEVTGGERDASVIAAAIELYLSTWDKAYLGVIGKLAGTLPGLKLEWPLPRVTTPGKFRYVPPFLARLYPRLEDGDLKETVLATCRRAAGLLAERMEVRPWPLDTWEFGLWGNNGTGLSRVFDTYWLTDLAPDILPPGKPLRNMLWLFGLHPTCDTVFVAGLGFPETQHLYNCHLHALNGYEPGNVPGAVIPGMGGFWYSGVVTYIDEHGYYGHNEACIYTQAQYIFAVNAMQAMGF